MLLFKDKINYKLPRANGFVAHIDAPAYSHMGEMEHIEVMIAVDEQTSRNGCLELVPKSHRDTIVLKNGGCIDTAWEASHRFLRQSLDPGRQLPLHSVNFTDMLVHNPGDILIFGSRLAHRSGPNPTDDRRAAIFATYHFDMSRKELRDEYYNHRQLHFPSDHGKP